MRRRLTGGRWAGALPLLAWGMALVAPANAERHDSRAKLPEARAEFVTLGTGGGPLARLDRSQPSNALGVGDAVYLFDVGDGVQRQMVAASLRLRDVRAIFVSHHHIDHNGDLAPLLVTRWLFNNHEIVPVIGPPGTVWMVEQIASAYRATELAPITIGGPKKPAIAKSVAGRDLAHTLNEPAVVYEDDAVRVLAVANAHYHFAVGSEEDRFARSYSFRVETAQRTFVYTGDTGPSENVVKLAADAAVLVSEVIDLAAMGSVLRRARDIPASALAPMLAHMEQDHLTPVQVGRLAAKANVKRVVLTHLAPGMDDEEGTTGYIKGIAGSYSGPVSVAHDLDRF